ncbi:MAG: prenyltransferase, partial [Coriobacteriales bacterium]|nr:prenyltransferase [Coriobacteriales bacterium]
MNQSAVNLETTCYRRFTLKAAWELAAPRTWSAAISPVLIGGAFALATGAVPLALNARLIVIWVCMLITSVLMQSAANALNDYKDFISGTDDASNAYDPTDASIIYNAVNPKCALQLCVGLLVAAAICGTVVVMLSSAIIAVIGAVAALTVVFYSAGPRPISYLPLSETVSGIVMGGFITFATSYALSGVLDVRCMLVALPAILCIGLIMQTNNTCDVIRDARVGRVTIPILLGAKRSIAIMTTLACALVCGI